MNILGIFGAIDWDSHKTFDKETGDYTAVHDSGATLFIDGKLISSILEERLTKYKMEGDFPYKSIEYCLSMGNIKGEDIDVVYMPHLPCNTYQNQKNDGTLDKIIKKLFPNALFKTISHHLCHAASSVFSSSMDQGTFFTLDGTGSAVFHPVMKNTILYECNSIGYFNKTKRIMKFFPNLAGTNGFGSYHCTDSAAIYFEKIGRKDMGDDERLDENISGKIMGLAAYGDYTQSKKWKEYKFVEDYDLPFLSFCKNEQNNKISVDDKAAVLQKNFESALLELLEKLKEKTYLEENVCFAGGCFLNVLANTLIKKSNLFENIHIPPFTNDSGISFGAAAYASFIHDTEHEIQVPKNLALMGKIYTDDEIEHQLKLTNLKYERYENFEDLCDLTAQKLKENKIIGWFQNSSESGPRALGSRSILMNPTPRENKDILNLKVKHREEWRPFAGIILEEYLTDYFEDDIVSPYMLYSHKVKEDKKNEIAAIVHKDDTCRVQTITEDYHYEVHTLLNSFYKVSGIPVILNTSFNDNGQPIIESPEDAVTSFEKMNLDYLVIGNYFVSKK